MHNQKIIIVSVLIICFIIMSLVFVSFFPPKGGNEGVPTPTPAAQGGQSGAMPGVNNTIRDDEQNRQSFMVGQLISLLPYNGGNFSFYYNISKNQFILYLNPSALAQGDAEFDVFLKQNGVDSRLWIENLVNVSGTATPSSSFTPAP